MLRAGSSRAKDAAEHRGDALRPGTLYVYLLAASVFLFAVERW
jgi:hypothetical protein